MTLARTEYFQDLLEDCYAAASAAGVPADQEGSIIAAMILSDSYNGLRKAMLQVESVRQMPRFLVKGGE